MNHTVQMLEILEVVDPDHTTLPTVEVTTPADLFPLFVVRLVISPKLLVEINLDTFRLCVDDVQVR